MSVDLNNFYLSLVVIVLIVFLGFILGKKGWIKSSTNKQLVNLLLMVFMPASLLNAFPSEYSKDLLDLFATGFLGGLLVMVSVIIVARLIFNKKLFKKDLNTEAQFAFIFNNATFLGYPLISSAFGENGIVPYCGFIIAFNFALFSYGIFLFEKKINKAFIVQCFTNPNIIAVLVGMVMFLLHLSFPSPVTTAIGYVASVTTPLSLICIGYMLSAAKFKKLIKKWKLFIIAAIQLVLGPLMTWGLLTLFHFPSEVVIVCTLIQALPTATSLGLFAEKYGGNVLESSELVAISTLMSTVTLPVVVFLLFSL